MSTVRRDFRASPHRTGCETWEAIARVLAPSDGSVGRKELLAVTGIAAQLISTETAKDYPIISAGAGSQVRIYCIYDEDALDEDNGNEAALAFDATSGDWKFQSLPRLKMSLGVKLSCRSLAPGSPCGKRPRFLTKRRTRSRPPG